MGSVRYAWSRLLETYICFDQRYECLRFFLLSAIRQHSAANYHPLALEKNARLYITAHYQRLTLIVYS